MSAPNSGTHCVCVMLNEKPYLIIFLLLSNLWDLSFKFFKNFLSVKSAGNCTMLSQLLFCQISCSAAFLDLTKTIVWGILRTFFGHNCRPILLPLWPQMKRLQLQLEVRFVGIRLFAHTTHYVYICLYVCMYVVGRRCACNLYANTHSQRHTHTHTHTLAKGARVCQQQQLKWAHRENIIISTCCAHPHKHTHTPTHTHPHTHTRTPTHPKCTCCS